jgi:hypothetical protein
MNENRNKRIKQKNNIIDTYISDNSVGLEIGVFKGGFASHILNRKKIKKLYLLDPWSVQVQYPGRLYDGKRHNMSEVERNVRKSFGNMSNVEIIKDISTNVRKYIGENELDWVYVDGNHSYKFVLEDLENCRDLVKKNGYIMCDDYNWRGPNKNELGPKKAIHEFATKYNLEVILTGKEFNVLAEHIGASIKNIK